MPSTYNNNLRLEMIANGEQSGTWGATTNTNLGTLLVDAITSTVEVTVIAGNQAFTVANGSVDESRCAAIVLTTTTGANFNVYAPSVEKLYVIKNSSAYQATIFCNSATAPAYGQAGAGYSIPAGRTVFIRSSNETTGNWEFKNCIDSFGTTGLPVVSGGTGLATVPAFSVPVSNSLNTLTALTVAANQSIRLNSTGTAWEAYPVSAGGISQIIAGTGLSGGTITTSGTIALASAYGDTLNPYASKVANYVLASPNGSAGAPSFRALVAADLPNIPVTNLNGGSGASASTFWRGDGTWAPASGGGGVTSVTGSGAITASPTTGAVTVSVANASSSTAGILTTGSQNIAGTKIFDTGLISGNGYNFTSNSSLYWTGIEAQIRIAGNMRFFVNNSSAGFDLSDVQKVGGGTFNSYSDARYKQDISSYTKGLAEIVQVQPQNYRYTAEFMKSNAPSQAFVGVVAQELENTAFANCVRDDTNGYKVVDTSELTYALINAVKELNAKVKQLEDQLNAM